MFPSAPNPNNKEPKQIDCRLLFDLIDNFKLNCAYGAYIDNKSMTEACWRGKGLKRDSAVYLSIVNTICLLTLQGHPELSQRTECGKINIQYIFSLIWSSCVKACILRHIFYLNKFKLSQYYLKWSQDGNTTVEILIQMHWVISWTIIIENMP